MSERVIVLTEAMQRDLAAWAHTYRHMHDFCTSILDAPIATVAVPAGPPLTDTDRFAIGWSEGLRTLKLANPQHTFTGPLR